jgi:putative tryptophan/tyrosine transport system substrate-binding protein
MTFCIGREFITLLGGAAAAWPLAAGAQQSAKAPRIGYLGIGPASRACVTSATSRGITSSSSGDGRKGFDQLPELAAELVRMNVDVIFASSSTEVEAARRATRTIPIVFAVHADPVGLGHVASLARPGGNIISSPTSPPRSWRR